MLWIAHHKKENSQIQFYFIPISVPNRQRHKNSVQKQTSIEKYAYIQMSKNWSTLWHKLQRNNNLSENKRVEYQTCTNVHFSMCMSLYKSVNATLFVYGFYKIGPLNDRFFLPIAVHNQYWEGTLQHTNIQIHKQENKQKMFPVM